MREVCKDTRLAKISAGCWTTAPQAAARNSKPIKVISSAAPALAAGSEQVKERDTARQFTTRSSLETAVALLRSVAQSILRLAWEICEVASSTVGNFLL